MISSDIRQQQRQAGLRVTAPRECPLRWLAEQPHASAEQIHSGVARLDVVSPTHDKEARE